MFSGTFIPIPSIAWTVLDLDAALWCKATTFAKLVGKNVVIVIY